MPPQICGTIFESGDSIETDTAMNLESDRPSKSPSHASWDAVVKAALLGTGRSPLPRPLPSPEIEALLDRDRPDVAVLQALAIVSVQRRAAQQFPQRSPSAFAEADEPEELPECSAAARRLLHAALQDDADVAKVRDWLVWARAAGVRAAPERLPELLDLGARSPELRSPLRPVLGRRGAWLAKRRADWGWAIDPVAARLDGLHQTRARDAARAREELESIWDGCKASDRAQYLKTFSSGLSAADEPFLERSLNDTSQQVRTVAADLLACLPESDFCDRLTQWTRRHLRLQHHGRGRRLHLTLPKTYTAALERDGVKRKPPAKTQAEAWWLLQQLARVPLSVWEESAPPQAWLQAAERHARGALLREGWAVAAIRQGGNAGGNADWARSLLDATSSCETGERLASRTDRDRALLLQLPQGERETWVLSHLAQHPEPIRKRHPSLPLLQACDWTWSDRFARAVVERFVAEIAASRDSYDWAVRSTFREFARRFDPALEAELLPLLLAVAASGSYWMQTLEDVGEMLAWRRSLEAAFLESPER